MDRRNRKTVRVLEKEYQVICPEGEEESLRKAAYYLDKKMREIHQSGRVIGTERVGIMAGLNIAHELVSQREGKLTYVDADAFESRLQDLQDKLDEALADVVNHKRLAHPKQSDALEELS